MHHQIDPAFGWVELEEALRTGERPWRAAVDLARLLERELRVDGRPEVRRRVEAAVVALPVCSHAAPSAQSLLELQRDHGVAESC
jgi:hypothetical protein